MTPSRPANFAPRRAFTLVEILIVVAIIITLIAILIPSIGKVKIMAQVSTAKAELGAIQNGLQQYYNLFHVYPPSTGSQGYLGTAGRSPAMLAQGLMGYLPYDLDGAGPKLSGGGASPNPTDPAFGFRTRKSTMGGDIYGPYMQSDPKVYRVNSPTDQSFIDPWGHEILYYLSQGQSPTTNLIFSTNNPNALFNILDAQTQLDGSKQFDGSPLLNNPAASLKFMVLVNGNNSSSNIPNGTVTGSDSFLLLSAGPDGIYFTADDIVVGKN